MLYTGSVDNTARMWKLDQLEGGEGRPREGRPREGRPREGQLVAYHNAPVKCVKRHPNNENLVITASWDKTVKVWDVRKLIPI